VTERTFAVDNPFIFKTKKEVVETLADHKAADLIADTCSCSHLMFQLKDQRIVDGAASALTGGLRRLPQDCSLTILIKTMQ
jgi:hypothetical protein